MLVVAGVVSGLSRRPRVVILADMVWCSLIYQAGYLDYQEFEFFSLTRRERKTWITSGNATSIVVKYNTREFRSQFSDKARFNSLFDKWLGRDWVDVRETSVEELESFVTGHGTVMVKILSGMGGTSVQKVSAAEIDDFAAFHASLLTNEQYLVESFIEQHAGMAALCPTSVNSLRMITFFDGSRVHVLEAVLRMGNGAEVDNYARGGLYTVLDEKTGVAPFGAFDKYSNIFLTHPLTDVPIVGFEVPRYAEVLQTLDAVGRVVPEIPYVGWDVAISTRGPVVIEGNFNTGVFQMKPSLTGIKTGLLPRFRAVIDF